MMNDIQRNNENNKNKLILRISFILISIILILVCVKYKDKKSVQSDKTYYDFSMGTSISATIYADKSTTDTTEKIAADCIEKIKKLDTEVISWREETSELYNINASFHKIDSTRTAVFVSEKISDTLYAAIEESLKICKDSEGALDITIRPLLDCWNIENATADDFAVPSDEEIASAIETTGYNKFELGESDKNGKDITLHSCYEPVTIDLGSTGKGFVLDEVKTILEETNVKGALITAGGSILAYGSKPDGSVWKIGIRNPRGNESDYIGYLEFDDIDYICVSTSGDYEKYIEKDGIRYHHILDSKTGYPADSGLSSVTIVCKSGIDSDGLSTACFVLGIEKSKPLLEKYKAEAVFIDKDGVVTVTDGLKENYKGN